MIRQTQDTFRPMAIQPGAAACDPAFADNATPLESFYTTGITRLEPVNLFTGLASDKAAILGLTVGGGLVLRSGGTPSSRWGRFGRIIAGLTTIGTQDNSPSAAILPQLQPLPPDLSLVGDLWNPANDPLPPIPTSTTNLVPGQTLRVGLALTLPQPIRIANNNLFVGIWMLPSIIGATSIALPVPSVSLFLQQVTWSVTYDDGR